METVRWNKSEKIVPKSFQSTFIIREGNYKIFGYLPKISRSYSHLLGTVYNNKYRYLLFNTYLLLQQCHILF